MFSVLRKKSKKDFLKNLSHYLIGLSILVKGYAKLEHYHDQIAKSIFIFIAGIFIIGGTAFHQKVEKKNKQFPGRIRLHNLEDTMKKITLVLAVILALTFLTHTGSAEETNEIEKRIKQVTGVLSGDSASREEITTALLQLIDLSEEIFPPSKYSDEIHSEIEVAKSQFQNTSFLDRKGRQYLLMTYRMMTEGKKYQTPEELDDFISPSEAMEKARKYAKKLIDSALESYKAGDHAQTAVLLLELVIMIVTPISA